jgi:pimeloyl-ACP methyl ester carboxylesterase
VREVVRDGCIIPPFPPPRAKNASIGVTIVRAMSERDQGESEPAVDGGESYRHPRRGGEDRMRMLLEEVVLPARANYDRIVIMGWSMGAYGAVLAAQRHPELFSAVCADSVALRHGVSKLRNTPVRIACGARTDSSRRSTLPAPGDFAFLMGAARIRSR